MRRLLSRVSLSALVMLLPPWLAVTFAPADAGMAICFLLFFAVDPVYAIISGYSAGKDVRHLWSSPVITAVLFLLGTWMFFEPGELQFAVYALGYFVLGEAAMLLSAWLENRK